MTSVIGKDDRLSSVEMIPSTKETITKETLQKKSLQKKGAGASNGIPYQEIIEYLNLKTGKHFEHIAKETRSKIKARWGNNGTRKTLEDFKTVIDNKCAQWLNDPEWSKYLRPETLFGTKFEGYLNEIVHPLTGLVSNTTIKNIEVLNKWEPPKHDESKTF